MFAAEDNHNPYSTSAFNRNWGGLIMKKLQFGERLYIFVSEASSKCCEVSASSLPFVRNPERLLFQALHLRDITITVVKGSSVVEQKRKQEVNAAKPQVVLRRPAYIPLVAASFVMDARSKKQFIWRQWMGMTDVLRKNWGSWKHGIAALKQYLPSPLLYDCEASLVTSWSWLGELVKDC